MASVLKPDTFITATLISLVLVLSGCVSSRLTLEDCVNGDWYEIGRDDGTAGEDADQLSKHQKACAKQDIAADSEAYLRGYRDGNNSYCEAYDHYAAGIRGERHQEVCPSDDHRGAHQEGLYLYCDDFDHFAIGQRGKGFLKICPDTPFGDLHALGALEFCSNTNPFILARSRQSYRVSCSSEFNRAYELGERSLRIERRIRELSQQLNELSGALLNEKNPDAIERIKSNIESKKLSLDSQRRELRALALQVKQLGYLERGNLIDNFHSRSW